MKRVISVLMVLFLVVNIGVVYADVNEETTWDKDSLSEGEEFDVELSYPVDPDKVVVPEVIVENDYIAETEHRDVIKECLIEETEDNSDDNTIVTGDSTENETIPNDTVEDGEDEVILDSEPAVVEREDDSVEDKDIDNNVHDNVLVDSSTGSDNKEQIETAIAEVRPEQKEDKLPATGEGKKTLYILMGTVFIIYGLALKRRR